MLKKIFSSSVSSVTAAAILVASSSLASRLLGIVRDRILAGQFGAGDTLDIYYAAFRVPDFLYNLLVLGALSAGFIPVFTNLAQNTKEPKNNLQAWALANHLLNIILVVLGVLAVLGIIFAPQLMSLITPGFTGDKLAAVVTLTRIMFLSPLLLGISAVIGGCLQSFQRFFAYSLSPIFYNLGIIVGVIYLVPYYGAVALAWAVVLGALLHLVVQLPTLLTLGWRYALGFGWTNTAVRQVLKMMLPRTLTLGINQFNLVAMTMIASTLLSGSLAVFNLANNLQSFPIGIFGISFAIAVFPVLSAHAFDRPRLIKYFSKTLRQILFFIVPSTVIFLALRAQIVRLILGSGQFDWQDTRLTIETLSYFVLSLFAQSLLPLLVRVFYARHDSKTPFYLSLVAVAINIGLAWRLAPILGVAGLALSFSLAAILQFAMLLIALRLELRDLDEKRILRSVTKFIIAAIFSAAAIQAMKLLIWPYTDMTKFWGVLLQGGLAGIFGLGVYLAFCSLFKSEELIELWQSWSGRFLKKKPKVKQDQGEARGL